MEIGGLGMVNTISNINKNNQPTSTKDFAGVFSSLVTETPGDEELNDSISEEDLVELLQFLKTEDILDIEGGLELIEAVNSNLKTDLIAFDGQLNNSSTKSEIAMLEDGITKANIDKINALDIRDLILVLTEAASLPMNDFKNSLDSNLQNILKVAKSIELFDVNSQDSSVEKTTLKEIIQQLTKKIEWLASKGKSEGLVEGKHSTRMEYLQKTIGTLQAELNGQTLIKKEQNEAKTVLKSRIINGFSLFQNSTNHKQFGLSSVNELKEVTNLSYSILDDGIEQKSRTNKMEIANGFNLQQLGRPEQLTLMLNQSGKQISTTELIKQFESILTKSHLTNGVGQQRMLVKLSPEHLGSLRIELIQRETGIVARILTSTLAAKDTLESQINGLRQAFSSQNIQVDKIEISQQMSQQQEKFLNKDGQQQSGQQHQERPGHRQLDELNDESEFNTSFEDAFLNLKI
ncbi:flagellar hook-length control protein FliK [Bacillus dakarensis]|uniref:flagellar hook-length control protein FliK n=1 Tax=Robertmurraya dakarensis TaxID=1926278 RepID=UPI000982399E|nr:flagellar hook-length control protein FliK [Bacillus dakarensis]